MKILRRTSDKVILVGQTTPTRIVVRNVEKPKTLATRYVGYTDDEAIDAVSNALEIVGNAVMERIGNKIVIDVKDTQLPSLSRVARTGRYADLVDAPSVTDFEKAMSNFKPTIEDEAFRDLLYRNLTASGSSILTRDKSTDKVKITTYVPGTMEGGSGGSANITVTGQSYLSYNSSTGVLTANPIDLSGSNVTGILPSSQVSPPGSDTHVVYNSAGALAASPNLTFDGNALKVVSENLVNPRGQVIEQYGNHIGSAPIIQRKARGTLAAPTAVAAGDFLGFIGSYPFDGANFLTDVSYVASGVTGAVSSGVVPTSVMFKGGSTGGGYTPDVLIHHSGLVGIGENGSFFPYNIIQPSAQLHVKSRSASTPVIIAQGAVGQTADLIQARSSTGAEIAKITTVGNTTQLFLNGADGTFGQTGIYHQSNGVNKFYEGMYGASDATLGYSIYTYGVNYDSVYIPIANGRVGFNTRDPQGQAHVVSRAATDRGLIVQGATSQTANLLELRNAAGTAWMQAIQNGSVGQMIQIGDGSTGATIRGSASNNAGFDLGYEVAGTWVLSIGMNVSGTYGGTGGANSGRCTYVYDRVVNAYRNGTDSNGTFYIGAASSQMSACFQQPGINNIPATFRGVSGQVADLTKWQTNLGVDLVRVKANGSIVQPSNSMTDLNALFGNVGFNSFGDGNSIVCFEMLNDNSTLRRKNTFAGVLMQANSGGMFLRHFAAGTANSEILSYKGSLAGFNNGRAAAGIEIGTRDPDAAFEVLNAQTTTTPTFRARAIAAQTANNIESVDSAGNVKAFVNSAGRFGYDGTASAPANTTTPVAWADFYINGTLYKMPLYQ